MQEEVALYKDQIAEAVAMGDDELMEKFFSGEEFSDAELKRGVRIGVRNGEFVQYILVVQLIQLVFNV